MLSLVPEASPQTRFGRRWPWLFVALTGAIHTSVLFEVPFTARIAWYWLDPIAWGGFTLGMLSILVRARRLAGPAGRRRIKWVAFGCYLLYAPTLAQAVLVLIGRQMAIDTTVFALMGMLFPACLLLAVVRDHLFDIDRIISVTASYTVLGVLAVGALLVGFPRVAAFASDRLGLDPATGQYVFALALAGIVVPAHRRLRPQIDRVFFADRWAFERGVTALLRDLRHVEGPDVLFARTGEGLDALVHPETCVVFARTGDAFVPAFVRGRAVAAPFAATAPLIAGLSRRTALMVAERRRRRTPSIPDPAAAALETLGAAVVLPIHRRDELVALVILGAKRSGDVYTATDLTLLDAVAEKVSDELIRFDLHDVVSRAHAMEETLRRWVPAAVTSQLAAGGDVEAGEREVSVLFVDIRGYTSFSQARQAEEVFTTVNRYAEAVSAIARDRGGSIAEFSGDGMMVVFGAPQALDGKERLAVEAGRAIVTAVGALRPDGPNGTPLSVGVGIATGRAYVGDVRSAERRIWTAIGNTVNVAARLQQLTRSMDAAIVIDTPTRQAAGAAAADFVRREKTAIRGRSDTSDVWALPIA
jgi:class 3 adenylate cyclase